MTEKLNRAKKRFEILFEQTSLIMFINDPDGKILKANQAFCDLTGFTAYELNNKNIFELTHSSAEENKENNFNPLINNEIPFLQTKKTIITREGKTIPVLINESVITNFFNYFHLILCFVIKTDNDDMQKLEKNLKKESEIRTLNSRNTAMDSPGILEIIYLIQHIERLQNQIDREQLIEHDPLTGLLNRAKLIDQLNTHIKVADKNKKLLALISLDLDRFKKFNDTLGQNAGDVMLKNIATRLKQHAGSNCILARQGADEFILILPEINDFDTADIAVRKIFNGLRGVFQINKYEIFVFVSMGIAIFPFDGHDADTLFQNADVARSHIKTRGGNNYKFYTRTLDKNTIKKFELEGRLHGALDREEFHLFYQPQVNLETCKMTGFETLIRWNHTPELNYSPADFIPITEESGLIIPIGEWILRTACAQTKRWQDEGLGSFQIAVNFSPRQFQQPNLDRMIENILNETGLDPKFLEMEITEGTVMSDPDEAILTLRRLNEMGIRIAIDDFGTGYSSLAYLKLFPINTLKIDQSFVQGVPEDSDNSAIVATICAMAKALKIDVLAEGVENAEQVSFLHALSCNSIQGFFYSKALSTEKMTEFLRDPPTLTLKDFQAES